MTVSISIEQHRIVSFLGSFQGMKDLVLVVNDGVISGAGTCERSFFIKKWITLDTEEESTEGNGNIPIGQLELFKNLVANCGHGILKMEYDGGHIQIIGQEMSFSIPPVADATSQAGVELMEGLLVDPQEGFTLRASRDQIVVDRTEPIGEWSNTPDEMVAMSFGKWLMDALKAMPGAGNIYLVGGDDSPLLIRHTPPEDGDESWGTVCIVAPRQEEAGV